MDRKLPPDELVGRETLLDFVRSRHRWILVALGAAGRPVVAPVSGAVGPDGQLLISTYPDRDPVRALGNDRRITVCVQSDHTGGAWVQIDGDATVTPVPDALDGLVDHYRAVSGEHPDWEQFRQTMVRQDRCLISFLPERWGPIATGAFPASVASIQARVDRAGSQLDGAAPEIDGAVDGGFAAVEGGSDR